MAFNAGSIVAQLQLDAKNFQDGLNNAQKSATGFSDKVGKASAFAAKSIAAIGVAAAGVAVIAAKKGVDAAMEFEQQEIAFTTLLRDREKALAAIAAIEEDAKKTPYNLPDLIRANQLLISAGVSTNDAREQVLALGNAIAATGGGTDELNRMIVNLQQIKAVGKASALDIKQFAYAGINIYQLLADATGKNVDQVKDMEISYELLTQALSKASGAGGLFEGAMENQSHSLQGLKSNLEDVMGITLKNVVMQTGLYDAVKNATSATVDFITEYSDDFIRAITTATNKVKAFIDSMTTGFNNVKTTLEGKFGPLIEYIGTKFERLRQIMEQIGISGDFGGLINWLANAAEKVDFYMKRMVQIITDEYQKIKDILAVTPDATLVQAIEGVLIRLKPLFDELRPVAEKFVENLKLTGEIIRTQVKPAFDDFIEVLKPFLEAIMPYLIEGLKILAIVIGALLAAGLAFLTGIMSGLANALPYFAQAIEGLIQYWRGFIQFLTGIFTGNFKLVIEGIKQMTKGMYDFVTNIFLNLLKFIKGFIDGVTAFFKGLYDTLIGHSIIPDIVNGIQNWFNRLPGIVRNAVSGITDILVSPFQRALDRIRDIYNEIKDKLDFTQRHSPSVVDVVNRGVNLVNKAFDQLAYTGDFSSRLVGANLTGGGSTTFGGITINLDGAIIGDRSEASELAEAIGDGIINRLKSNVRF